MRAVVFLALALVFLLVSAVLALAAEAVPIASSLSLPLGDWLIAALNVVSAACLPALVGFLGVAIRRQVPVLGQFLTNALIDRMVRLAVAFALNAVEGAAKGKTVDVKVAPLVVTLGAQRAIDSTLPWIAAQAGGPEGIARRIFRSLDLDAAANANNVLAPALDALAAPKAA